MSASPDASYVKAMVSAGDRFARISSNPLPYLLTSGFVGVDDKVLSGTLSDLMIDPQPCGPVWNGIA